MNAAGAIVDRETADQAGVLLQASATNAEDAKGLVNGRDLSGWHSRLDRGAELDAEKTKQAAVFDERQKTIAKFAMTVMAAVVASCEVSIKVAKE